MTVESILSTLIRRMSIQEAKTDELNRRFVHAPLHADVAKVYTIDAGVIFASRPNVTLFPESGTSDTLNEIENFSDGKMLVISNSRDGDTITINDYTVAAGNIHLANGATTLVLDNTHDSVVLIYRESTGHWEHVSGAGGGGVSPVTSVNGETGDVVLDTDDVDEGATNLYWTQERSEDATAGQLTGNTGRVQFSYDDTTGVLTAILDVSAADRILYSTGIDAWAETALTAFGRSLIDDADAAAGRSTLGITAYDAETVQDIVGLMVTGNTETLITVTYQDSDGTLDFEITDAELTALAGLVSAADRLPYFTGSGTADLATFTAFGRSLVDDADAAAGRSTLGITVYDQETAEDIAGGMVSGNTETGISVTYDDATGKLNFDAQTAGDARYAPIAKGVTGGDSHDHSGGDGAQIDHGSLSGLTDDDHHGMYMPIHGISTTGGSADFIRYHADVADFGGLTDLQFDITYNATEDRFFFTTIWVVVGTSNNSARRGYVKCEVMWRTTAIGGAATIVEYDLWYEGAGGTITCTLTTITDGIRLLFGSSGFGGTLNANMVAAETVGDLATSISHAVTIV